MKEGWHINTENRKPINTTLNPYLSNRLNQLVDNRNVPVERLLDKAVELLLEYMESHDTVSQQVKESNEYAIKKNNEMIEMGRDFINKKSK